MPEYRRFALTKDQQPAYAQSVTERPSRSGSGSTNCSWSQTKARIKVVDRSPQFLPVVLEQKRVPGGAFGYAPYTRIDPEVDTQGNSTAWCATLRNWRIPGMHSNGR